DRRRLLEEGPASPDHGRTAGGSTPYMRNTNDNAAGNVGMSYVGQEPFIRLAGGPVPEQLGQPHVLLGTPVAGAGSTPDGVWARWDWDGTTLTVQNDRLGCFPLYYAAYADRIA